MTDPGPAAETEEDAPQPEPLSWTNWQAARSGGKPRQIVEMRLYSDAWYTAEAYDFGPYSFLNPVPRTRRGTMYELKPGVVLRVGLMLAGQPSIPRVTSDDHYHGGTMFDEMAALASLLLEARLIAGPIDREFGMNSDPLGRPRTHDASYVPLLPTINQAPQIPRLNGQRELTGLAHLATYPLLSADSAIALVKAARLYQNALWIADSAPETAWLLFVSGIETAAKHWDGDTNTPEERLAITYAPLIALLEKHDVGALVPKVARILKGVIGSTNKFLTFMETFAPAPPAVRSQWGKLDYEPEAFRLALKRIYGLRSRALHEGIPFPYPMCQPPETYAGTEPEEVPTGLAFGAMGATWAAADMPMLLHTFAYLTRGALLNWWQTLVPEGAQVDQPPFRVSPYG